MAGGWAIVDGVGTPLDQARLPVADPGLLQGWTVFDTFCAQDGVTNRLDAHLDRLAASAAAALIGLPDRSQLASEVVEAARNVPGWAVVRITLTRGGHRLVTATALDPTRRGRAIRAIRGPHRDEPFLGGGPKHGSRCAWAVAVARSGVDDVLLVDDRGRFTEATTAGIVAVCDGALVTAPHDGSILPSTTVSAVCALARDRGVEVVRARPSGSGPWDGLYVASVTRGLAPVVELDGVPLPEGEPVGRALALSLPQG